TPSLGLLTDSNVVDVYLGVSSLAMGDEFRGGAYVDIAADAASLANFLTMVEGATYNYYVLGDGYGSHAFGGSQYYAMDEFDSFFDVRLSTVAETAAFAPGIVHGGVMQFTIVPEPSTMGLLAAGILGLLAIGGRKRR
ncbi:MAG: PEP-CTERM sorting domain-containing protein, partial [Patescibacteria group bacterium]|nr:PEP-CTERM sorting domain-containing protein [Patescibacteria group bacterium]